MSGWQPGRMCRLTFFAGRARPKERRPTERQRNEAHEVS